MLELERRATAVLAATAVVFIVLSLRAQRRPPPETPPGIPRVLAVRTTESREPVVPPQALEDLYPSLHERKEMHVHEEAPATCGRDGIVALTYASHHGRDDRFCRALESAVRNGIDLEVLGWGVPWEGLSQKLAAALDAVRRLPPDCVVLFSDAYDVLYARDLASVAVDFRALGRPLVFSAECGCWPHVLRDRGRTCRDKFPPSPTPYRYLNSGGWIGTAAAASTFLRRLVDDAAAATQQDFHKLNDQELAADLYLRGDVDLALDFYATIFQPTHAVRDDTAVPDCDPVPHLAPHRGILRNVLTDTLPAVYHFNGGGKDHHLRLEGHMWWRKCPAADEPSLVDFVKSTSLAFDHRRRTFDDVCPDYFETTRRRRRPSGLPPSSPSRDADSCAANVRRFARIARHNRTLDDPRRRSLAAFRDLQDRDDLVHGSDDSP